MFFAYPLAGGVPRRFCSRTCYGLSKRGMLQPRGGQTACACRACGVTFMAPPRKQGRRALFCSRACYASAQRGKPPAQLLAALVGRERERAARWIGGRINDGRGYVLLRIGRRYRPEHRVVMEEALGRPLTRTDVVHHRNGIKDDNRPENLQLTTASEHRKLHARNST